MVWAQLLVGLLILTMGRQLFWLFVAAVGFLYGLDVAPSLFPGQSPEVLLLVGLAAGLIGAVFAYFLQWVAAAVAGFLVGGRLAVMLALSLGPAASASPSVPFIIGGIIGAIVLVMFFDWALILLSAIIGAMMIVDSVVPEQSSLSLVLLSGLTALGVIIQAAWLQRPRTVRYRHV